MKKIEFSAGKLPVIIQSRKSKNSLLKRIVILALLGMFFGTFLDFMHVFNKTTKYTYPVFFGVAWWIPLLYTASSVLIGLVNPVADKILGRKKFLPIKPRDLVLGFIGFCLVWYLSGSLHFSSVITTIILTPFTFLLWWKFDRTKEGIILALTTAFCGCLAEIIISKAGLFQHTFQDFLGIPFWLPLIYISGSISLGNIGRWLTFSKIDRI